MHPPQTAHVPPRLATPAAVAEFLAGLTAVVDAFEAAIEKETDLIARARLAEAAPFVAEKSALARRYALDLETLKANASAVKAWGGAPLKALVARQARLNRAMDRNLATLATAHAVAEGVIRIAVSETAAKAKPATYGADGRANALPPRASTPVAVSRSL